MKKAIRRLRKKGNKRVVVYLDLETGQEITDLTGYEIVSSDPDNINTSQSSQPRSTDSGGITQNNTGSGGGSSDHWDQFQNRPGASRGSGDIVKDIQDGLRNLDTGIEDIKTNAVNMGMEALGLNTTKSPLGRMPEYNDVKDFRVNTDTATPKKAERGFVPDEYPNLEFVAGNPRGVDPRLLQILNQAAADSPYRVQIISGKDDRPTNPGSIHPKGMAVDVQLVDDQNNIIPNKPDNWTKVDPAAFRINEDFAHQVKLAQEATHPDFDITWGGYFWNGGPGNYGYMDMMHFSNGEQMGNGSWEKGLLRAPPGVVSKSLSEAGMAPVPATKQNISTDGPVRIEDQTSAALAGIDPKLMEMLKSIREVQGLPPVPEQYASTLPIDPRLENRPVPARRGNPDVQEVNTVNVRPDGTESPVVTEREPLPADWRPNTDQMWMDAGLEPPYDIPMTPRTPPNDAPEPNWDALRGVVPGEPQPASPLNSGGFMGGAAPAQRTHATNVQTTSTANPLDPNSPVGGFITNAWDHVLPDPQNERPAIKLSDEERTKIIQTVLGEAGGEGAEGMIGVANVIKNRIMSDRYSSDPMEVVEQDSQFSAWNDLANGGNNPGRFVPGMPSFDQAGKLVDSVFGGLTPDNTAGSLMYHADSITPYWSDEETTKAGTLKIGNHVFYPRNDTALGAIDTMLGAKPMTDPKPFAPQRVGTKNLGQGGAFGAARTAATTAMPKEAPEKFATPRQIRANKNQTGIELPANMTRPGQNTNTQNNSSSSSSSSSSGLTGGGTRPSSGSTTGSGNRPPRTSSTPAPVRNSFMTTTPTPRPTVTSPASSSGSSSSRPPRETSTSRPSTTSTSQPRYISPR